MENKNIQLVKNEWFNLPEKQFFKATDGQKASQNTLVKLKTDGTFLFVEFECLDNPFVNQNYYTEHNSEMYNQEVFEIFIANGTKTPTKYMEIEINPNNALFVGWIENNTGEKPDKLVFIDHANAGIQHGVQKYEGKWIGFMNIPLALIGLKTNDYRINFFRIISKISQENKNWVCDAKNSEFICWSPTMSGNTPRFHRPVAFGNLTLT